MTLVVKVILNPNTTNNQPRNIAPMIRARLQYTVILKNSSSLKGPQGIVDG